MLDGPVFAVYGKDRRLRRTVAGKYGEGPGTMTYVEPAEPLDAQEGEFVFLAMPHEPLMPMPDGYGRGGMDVPRLAR